MQRGVLTYAVDSVYLCVLRVPAIVGASHGNMGSARMNYTNSLAASSCECALLHKMTVITRIYHYFARLGAETQAYRWSRAAFQNAGMHEFV